MDETTQQPTVYQLDEKRRIVAIDGPWDRFALDNDGASACTELVIGQPLLRFVCGDDACKLAGIFFSFRSVHSH